MLRVIKPRRMRWAGHVARMDEKKNACIVLVGMPEGKKQPGIHRRRWEANIKTDFRRIEWGGINWIILAENRDQWMALVNTAMNLRVLQNVGKFLSR
jgi:hypothetical protein